MEIFVARQPILTKNEEVVGYELLYRNGRDNTFSELDGDMATIDLLLNCFVSIGNEKLSNGKKLFINFTRNLLVKRIPCLFSPEKIVIEILEDIDGDSEVIAAITEFKRLGYTIALDDFSLRELNKSLLPFADIIKVDFLESSLVQRKMLVNISKNYNPTLLAEKIETRTDFEQAINEGFELFQGYFFSKPTILSASEVPFYSNDYMKIINELNTPEPSINKVTTMIECDLSLSYKILKIVNTLAYYTRVKITSIKQAILTLGLNELTKLLTIITLKERQTDSSLSTELVTRSLIRAKLAEMFGEELIGPDKKSECFMLGLFSLLDAILQQPMRAILTNLPLSDEMKNALLGIKSDFDLLVKLIVALERGDFEQLNDLASTVDSLNLSGCYEEAVQWVTEINTTI